MKKLKEYIKKCEYLPPSNRKVNANTNTNFYLNRDKIRKALEPVTISEKELNDMFKLKR